MRIKIQTKVNEAIVIDLGYSTPFHECMYWFSITKEYYDFFGEVRYASMFFRCFKHYKFWKW